MHFLDFHSAKLWHLTFLHPIKFVSFIRAIVKGFLTFSKSSFGADSAPKKGNYFIKMRKKIPLKSGTGYRKNQAQIT